MNERKMIAAEYMAGAIGRMIGAMLRDDRERTVRLLGEPIPPPALTALPDSSESGREPRMMGVGSGV